MKSSVSQFTSVYGPVASWRFGQSLGIDAIGPLSTCSFNCVYCQLGEIQVHTCQRQVFIPTAQIIRDLQAIQSFDAVDVVTLSGSGEPTLVLNLGEILTATHQITGRPTVVLTNSTLLTDPAVRSALALASQVAAKLDAVTPEQLQRINRPVANIDLPTILSGLKQFRQVYPGILAIQTMLLSPWTADDLASYLEILRDLAPDEVQLNIPSRPRVLARQLDARGNDEAALAPTGLRKLRCIRQEELEAFAAQLRAATHIPIRCAPAAD